MDLQQFVRSLNLLFFMLEVFFSVTISRNVQHHHHRHRHHLRRLNERHRRHFISSNITLGGNYNNASDVGPWGEWGEDSDCSRTCGGGVAFQRRKCLAESSEECTGPIIKYFSCNIQDCPEDSKDFRAEQCSDFDSIQFEGKFFTWEPYLKAPNKCELNCNPKGERFYYRHSQKVIDGTKCTHDSLDVCVDGQCMPVGCDMMLGSNAKEDRCRECEGDGSSCKTIDGVFELDDMKPGYHDILLIPPGATNIYIEERHPSNNYIAVRNLTGHYFLNGNWRIDFPREMHFAGATFHYDRKSFGSQAPENLRALGPTTEAIYIVLLYQETNKGIIYEYSVPVGITAVQPDTYTWTYGSYGDCSASCGEGYQTRSVNCARSSNLETVADDLCDPALRPNANKSCILKSCPPEWHVGEWEECSASCGGGVEFRVVYCQQIKQGDTPSIVNQNLCLKSAGPRPMHIRACNEGIKCPEWHAGPWSLCNKMCGDGVKSRLVTCQKNVNGTIHVYPDFACDSDRKPQTKLKCNSGPCEGVDWIVSDWSGCDTCGLLRESRLVHCSNQSGNLFPDDLCDHDRQPDFLRDCPDSPPCDVMWHATEWSECSAKCGTGIQTRKVFCATTDLEDIKKVPNEKCNPLKKYDEVRNCTSKPCKGMWFSGPWNRCTVPCGGGQRTRKILCLLEDDKVVDTTYCDPSERPSYRDSCNQHPCDPDEVLMVGGCKESKYGCCPDGITKAGPNFSKCPKLPLPKEGCEATEFRCCADGITPALGPFGQGCPKITHCKDTKHKCCPDGITPAKGPDNKGCPPIKSCANTKFGCCPDGTSPAKGKNYFGCENVVGQNCSQSKFGCCPDGIAFASGPELAGCPEEEKEELEGSGEDCHDSLHGCCPDGVSTAQGPNFRGCADIPILPEFEYSKENDCEDSEFGCCRDGITAATGPKFAGCEEKTTVSPSDCENSLFGCCPDGITAATGDKNEGCPTNETEACLSTLYGCCLDGTTAAQGFNMEGCETPPPINCWETDHGCCPDKRTPALGPGNEGCPCETTYFGCCPDGITVARGANYEGCNCEITPYGCCPDDTTEAKGPNMEGCGCHASSFGCCPDGKNAAEGPNYEGCCSASPYGCCPDEKTLASGPNYEGCPCELSQFGCCPDGTTFAKGPDSEGCPCEFTLYGCCPDGKTIAKGPDHKGCRCEESTFGCCPDYQTAASGLNFEGCPCDTTPYGCCADGETVALGLNYEGCPCENLPHGCCPDGITKAEGPNHQGCPCSQMTHGCCPDGKTPATGPNYEGCGCSLSIHGCCPDGVTAAQGPDNLGCCDSTHYGCCPDRQTIARGPNYEGCPCDTSPFGCCPDGHTLARGYNNEGCPCATTLHGCCPDGITAAQGSNYEGCDCEVSTYGCCPDRQTPAQGPNEEGCGCEASYYGCCPDNRTPRHEGCGCESTHYGCCPDGQTPARGPQQEGCGCESTHYGCCDDGRTPARGPQQEGCGCESTHYGCCPDGQTPARGPQQEGCGCESTHYGCCDDGTPARGPQQEGCGCDTTRFGCCRDGQTPAQGPHQEGCDCRNTTYGCCSDNRTPARGPQQEGCCETTRYGCCPDNRLAAQGPNFFGCACEHAPYGCCLDGVTIARGPNNEGCGCEASQHGCCPDGIKSAKGPNHEGCKDEVTSPSKPGEVCGLPKERGGCSNFTVKWFFDMDYGGCSRFWYGGCDGNENRFDTQEECEEVCVAPEGMDACHLPKVGGPCEDHKIFYYYDHPSGQCGQFYYGGCLGNNNRFETQSECEQTCAKEEIQDPCLHPKAEGPCHGEFLRWYYNKESGTCSQFRFGGCKGNQNNFESEQICIQQCASRHVKDVCTLPKAEGPCTEQLPRWFYDSSSQQCSPFHYGGCEGNANRFESDIECQRVCAGLTVTDICSLPKDSGPCVSGKDERWYYDKESKRCNIFTYSGCGGNSNNFESQEECENRCSTPIVSSEDFSLDDCKADKSYGKCEDNIVRWFYDKSDGVCKQFYYSGCNGNKNRFATRTECEKRCFHSQDICQLPKVGGPCTGQFHQWYYNNGTGTCEEFFFGGCEGNGNRFDSQVECEAQCKKVTIPPPAPTSPPSPPSPTSPTTLRPWDQCSLPKDPGPCQSSVVNWFFDYDKGRCEQFIYGGCEGNTNRFATEESCDRACGQYKDEDVCNMPEDPGPCLGSFPKWYHNPVEHICKSFIYGGCHGNGNRFSTKKECEQVCVARKPHENETSVIPAASCPDPIDCNTLNCPYAIDEYTDHLGCLQCRCTNPCEGIHCQEGYACVIESTSSVQELSYGQPVCRPKTETPEIPPPEPSEQKSESPQIRPVESEIRILQNSSLHIPCITHGYPKPRISWKKDDLPLAVDGVQYRSAENGSLIIPNVTLDFAGTYTCVADNGIGIPAENSVRLIVEVLVTTKITLETTSFAMDSNIRINCEAEGSQQLSWYKDGILLQSDSRTQLMDNGTIVIYNAIPSDTATYRCEASNAHNVASSSVGITVDGFQLHPNCTDNPYFANCKLIVKAKYCINKYYARFCCKSCTLAGQLDINGKYLP